MEHDKIKLIKVPYFDPKNFREEQRGKFNERDLEKVDPFH